MSPPPSPRDVPEGRPGRPGPADGYDRYREYADHDAHLLVYAMYDAVADLQPPTARIVGGGLLHGRRLRARRRLAVGCAFLLAAGASAAWGLLAPHAPSVPVPHATPVALGELPPVATPSAAPSTTPSGTPAWWPTPDTVHTTLAKILTGDGPAFAVLSVTSDRLPGDVLLVAARLRTGDLTLWVSGSGLPKDWPPAACPGPSRTTPTDGTWGAAFPGIRCVATLHPDGSSVGVVTDTALPERTLIALGQITFGIVPSGEVPASDRGDSAPPG